MTSKAFKGGRIYTLPLGDIEYIGYFEADKKNEEIKSAKKRITSLRGRSPDFLMNAELFDFITRRAASDVVAGGEVVRLTEGYGFAFPENRTAVFSYKNNANAPDYIGAYPTLVRNGEEVAQNPAGITGRRGRTALGLTEEELCIALIPDKTGATLSELRKQFIKTGVKNAINLDGGGSTQFYAPDANFFSGRRVRGFIGIWVRGGDRRRVNVRTSLNVRSGPGILHKRIGRMYNGDIVRVEEEQGAWCRVANGWVHSDYLSKIK